MHKITSPFSLSTFGSEFPVSRVTNELFGMWTTLNLLVARECRKTPRDVLEELEEWLESVTTSAGVGPRERNDDTVRAVCGTPTSTGVPDLPREKEQKTRQHVKSGFRQAVCR
jgi:hypothetical protein